MASIPPNVTFTFATNVTTSTIAIFPPPQTYTTNVIVPVTNYPRQRPMKVHLRIKTGEVQGFPTKWAACNVRSRPGWRERDFPLMSEDPKNVTCKNCLRRMGH